MNAVQHKSEGLVWFEGKGSNSHNTGPVIFILNSGHVYFYTENSNMTTLTYHVTFACIHYNPLCFHLTLKIVLLAIQSPLCVTATIWDNILTFCHNEIRQRWLSQVSVSLWYRPAEKTNPTNKQINVKLRKMCYLNMVDYQVIASTVTKKMMKRKNKKTCCSGDVANHL